MTSNCRELDRLPDTVRVAGSHNIFAYLGGERRRETPWTKEEGGVGLGGGSRKAELKLLWTWTWTIECGGLQHVLNYSTCLFSYAISFSLLHSSHSQF